MSSVNSFSIIGGKDVAQCIDDDYPRIYQLISDTYKLYGQGKAINPGSQFLRFPEKPQNRIIALPAAITDGNRVSGIKWVASYPENIMQGMPRASAVILLNDYQTGFPIACIEGAYISAVRTVLSALLFLEQLITKSHISKLGIIGSGFIALNFLRALAKLNWSIGKINIYDINSSNANNFSKKIQSFSIFPGVACNIIEKDELLGNSDVVLLATTATSPHIYNIPNTNIIILNLSLRDLSPDILLSANNFVDDIDHILSANTSPHLAYSKVGNKKFITGTLNDLCQNPQKYKFNNLTIFSPMGLGILDIAVANYIYQKLHLGKLCFQFNGFYS